jgi:hypothetical protein
MSGVVEVPLAEGGSVLIEVDDSGRGQALRSRGNSIPTTVSEPLDHLLASIGPVTQTMLGELSGLADSPHELEIEFGIKLSADAKVVIARAGGEANFRIALRWSRPDGESNGVGPAAPARTT